MRKITVIILSFVILLTSSECDNEPDPPVSTIGHLKLTVTYPEAVIDENGLFAGYTQVPGVGAEARLYNKDSRCIGYKDAGFGIAYIGAKLIQCRYINRSNEKGEISFSNIQAGEYYLTVYARQLYRYTQKYIEVPLGDTLSLIKNFTNAGHYFLDLEPWDYEMPTE